MALIPENAFPGKITAASVDYPLGSARDVVTPGDGLGTPWKAELLNDVWGFLQALLVDGSVTPSGFPDTAVASDYLTALQTVAASYAGTGLVVKGSQAFTASGSFVIPAGTSLLIAVAKGGGGGGGNGTQNGAAVPSGGGGGAAGRSKTQLYSVTTGTVTVTIGAGGVAATRGDLTKLTGPIDLIANGGGAGGLGGASAGTGSESTDNGYGGDGSIGGGGGGGGGGMSGNGVDGSGGGAGGTGGGASGGSTGAAGSSAVANSSGGGGGGGGIGGGSTAGGTGGSGSAYIIALG